jgi:hypothetical protein
MRTPPDCGRRSGSRRKRSLPFPISSGRGWTVPERKRPQGSDQDFRCWDKREGQVKGDQGR